MKLNKILITILSLLVISCDSDTTNSLTGPTEVDNRITETYELPFELGTKYHIFVGGMFKDVYTVTPTLLDTTLMVDGENRTSEYMAFKDTLDEYRCFIGKFDGEYHIKTVEENYRTNKHKQLDYGLNVSIEVQLIDSLIKNTFRYLYSVDNDSWHIESVFNDVYITTDRLSVWNKENRYSLSILPWRDFSSNPNGKK